MRKKDLLADKLAAGTADVSLDASWWSRHSCSVYVYIKAMRDLKERNASGATAIRIAKGWDEYVGDPRALMLQHTTFELSMVDAAAMGDSAAISKIQEALEKNVQEQAVWYSSRIKGFPERTFVELMRTHVRLFLEAVIHKMDGNRKNLSFCEAKRGHNAASLGTLMTEWIC